ncbi:MAG TPA: hypothetical protein VJL89_01110, partial [Thermodesulfovibrionia bacterium]|nr:hypothetical protein [Thermodesulfovibrionia bacterium]
MGKLLLFLVFAISYQQRPLYSTNQHTYFLHGIASSDIGFLKQDWLSQTTDAVPVFSALVSLTIQVLGENAFYIFYLLILAIYIYSVLGIACYVYGIDNSGAEYLSYFALLTVFYSGLISSLLSKFPISPLVALIVDPNGPLTVGVAGQYILGQYLQPCVFGVFIVTSIYAFLRDKPYVAVVYLALSATFHPTYILSAAVLTCAYMVVIFVKKTNLGKVLLVGTLSTVLVIPILAYTYLNYRPTTADITSQAQSILVDTRIPHHAKPAKWYNKSTVYQIIVVVLGIYLARRTKLFLVMLLPFIAATLLTVVQVVTTNKSLALMFPWRISVFLVPIASSIILGFIVSVVFRILGKPIAKIAKPLQAVILTVIIIVGYFGVRQNITLFKAHRVGITAYTQFV